MDSREYCFGCLIRVRDLNAVRPFYQDTLALGDPILDSNFWLEFALPGNGILILEQSNSVSPGEGRHDVSCLIECVDFDEELKRLAKAEVALELPSREIPGRRTASLVDPEGNLITLYNRLGEVENKN